MVRTPMLRYERSDPRDPLADLLHLLLPHAATGQGWRAKSDARGIIWR